jgi:hypothetical protein
MSATTMFTMLDVAKLNGNDAVVGLIEENLASAPEARLFPMRTITGTTFKTVKRIALPTTGFRQANGGFTPSKSRFEEVQVSTRIFGGLIKVDAAVADALEDGRAGMVAAESVGVMESALRELGSQIWYGTSNDANGFGGLKDFTTVGTSTVGDVAHPFTLDATGSAPSTASSVYLVKFGPQYCQMIGGNGDAFNLGEFKEQLMTAASGSGESIHLFAQLQGWIGLSIQSQHSVRRIYNLTAESGKMLTDALLYRAMDLFPVGVRPDAIFMSRRSASQLQTSRTVTLFGSGTNRPSQPVVAPRPIDFEGVPIIETDSILNTDAIGS